MILCIRKIYTKLCCCRASVRRCQFDDFVYVRHSFPSSYGEAGLDGGGDFNFWLLSGRADIMLRSIKPAENIPACPLYVAISVVEQERSRTYDSLQWEGKLHSVISYTCVASCSTYPHCIQKLGHPKSVVIELGIVEDGFMNYNYPNPNSMPPVLWGDQTKATAEAFVSIGMGQTAASGGYGVQYLTESNLYYFRHNSGLHSSNSWSDVFTHSVGLMYRYQYPDKTKSQLNANLAYEYPMPAKASESQSSDGLSDGQTVYAILSPLFTFVLGLAIMHYYYSRKLGNAGGPADKSIPMSSGV